MYLAVNIPRNSFREIKCFGFTLVVVVTDAIYIDRVALS